MNEIIHWVMVIQDNNKGEIVECSEGESILTAMRRHGVKYRHDCGGRGTCGKCRIQVLGGEFAITAQDRKIFSEEELNMGYRLACKAYPKEKSTIKLLSVAEEDMSVVTENRGVKRNQNIDKQVSVNAVNETEELNYGIAIDLGTTTVAVSLFELLNGKTLRTYTAMNPQRAYGTDVVTRMNASNEGLKTQLQKVITDCLLEGVLAVIQEEAIEVSRIKGIAIAGNTTMVHLLMGYSCETLGTYPFTPVKIETIRLKAEELFTADAGQKDSLSLLKELPVTILPGISTFVGGDISAGLLVCGFHAMNKPCMLIDFGTNGEMAVGNKERIYVTSTAAGPAFEGGNISCGVGSIPGAISHFSINGHEVSYETIDNQPPNGVCGTGVMEIASELYKASVIDGTGLLIDEYFTEGYPIHIGRSTSGANARVIFTQKDIRELQFAKAAVRAGIEVLIKQFGITMTELDKVYLAGGFGFWMNVNKAIHIGLLPGELQDKIEVIGNSSLGGAKEYLIHENWKEKLDRIISISKEIHLSNDDDFNELYIKYMSFE